MRKTMEVDKIRQRANELLALPNGGAFDGKADWINADFRMGVAALLEHILHESDNYRGFNLQSSEWLPEEDRNYGDKPGPVKMIRDGADETRKVFF